MMSEEEDVETEDLGSTTSFNEFQVESVTVEELLITCVMARPPLWDSRLPLKDGSRTIRDKLWIEIFREFGENPEFSVEFLMKKWRNLRDTYVRIKGEYTPSGSAAKKKKKWEFFDSMQFLNDSIHYKPTVTNLCSGEASTSSTPSPIVSPTANNVEKRERCKASSGQKVEGAIVDALNKINSEPQQSSSSLNTICVRISELLMQMPQQQRTLLEIKLLQIAYEAAKDFL